MNEFEYKDVIPANARVIVDYTKPPKNRVKFSYPREWTYNKAVWKENIYTFFALWWFLVIFLVVIPISLIERYKTEEVIKLSHPAFAIENAIWTLSVLALLILTPLLLNFILSRNPKIYGQLIPRLNYWMFSRRKKYVLFEPKDIIEKKAVIPMFSNVYLDYKATGDFEKYLEKVEILELPFHYWRGSKKGKPKLEKNDYYFRAVFYFKEQPKNGHLEVKFI